MSTAVGPHLKHEALVGGVSNAFFNGLIAWLLLRGGSSLAWSGEHSFVVDILATAFILPFIVALIVIPLQKRKLNKGALEPVSLGPESRLQQLVNKLPRSTWANALCFGVIGLVVAAPPPLALFYVAGVEQIAPAQYALFKGLWAGAMAAILVVPMVLSALRTPQAPPAVIGTGTL